MASTVAAWSAILTGALPALQAPERAPKFTPRPRTTAAPRVLKYKQYADSEPRERRVWIEFPAGENCGEATFETFDVAKWRAEQDKVPAGSIHPRSAAVVESMRDPPPGERLHPDRNTMPTASGLASLMAPQDYNYEEAHLAGYDDIMEYQVAVATGKARKKPQTHHMKRGNDEEAEILDLFELITGLELYRDKAMGFVVHYSGKPGATPDGVCVRVPLLVEAKSTDKRLTDDKIPAPHYYQTQTQMYVTMDSTTGLPRMRNVGYIQYCSHPELKRTPYSKSPAIRSSEPRVRILLVKFNAETAARLVDKACCYMDRLSAARAAKAAEADVDGSAPNAPAPPTSTPASTPRAVAAQLPYPDQERGHGRGRVRGRGRARGGFFKRGRGNRGRGTPAVRGRAPPRVRRGSSASRGVVGVKFHARVRHL